MTQLMGSHPPICSLHQQMRIIIFVGEKSVKDNSTLESFLRDFGVADISTKKIKP
jgi:hypothetical protein